jgi:cation/acetate symporter
LARRIAATQRRFARLLGVIVLVCCSFTYVTAQIYGTGLIASRFLGMQFEIAVFAGLVGILLCASSATPAAT